MRISVNAAGVVLQVPGSRVVWPAEGEAVVKAETAAAVAKAGPLVFDAQGVELAFKLAGDPPLDAAVDASTLASLRRGEKGDTLVLHLNALAHGAGRVVALDVAPSVPEWAEEFELAPGARGRGHKTPAFPSTGRSRVAAMAGSVAVVSEATGAIALIRPGDKALRLALRLRVDGADTLHASPTDEGLLVTHLSNGRHAVVLHISDDGELVGDWEGWGSPPALWLGDRALVYDDDAAKGGHLLDRELFPVGRLDVTFRPLVAATSPDGRRFAYADEASILRGEREPNGTLTVEHLAWADLRRAVKRVREVTSAAAAYSPRRAHGAPSVGFPARPVTAPAWNVTSGPFAVTLALRSTGGPGRGVQVEASGAALTHLELTHLEHAGVRAPFETKSGVARATLPDVPLEAGLLLPLEPAPKGDVQVRMAEALVIASHVKVDVCGVAKAPSRDLLAITLRVPGVDSAPVKWTRPFVVDEG